MPILNVISLQNLVEDGVSGVSDFFQLLEKLFVGQEPALHKTSLFGKSHTNLAQIFIC